MEHSYYTDRIAGDDEIIVLHDYKRRQDLRASIARGLVRDIIGRDVAAAVYGLVDFEPDAVETILESLGVEVFGKGIGR